MATAEGYRCGLCSLLLSEDTEAAELWAIVLSSPCTLSGFVVQELLDGGLVLLERPEGEHALRVDWCWLGPRGEFDVQGISAGPWRLAYYPAGKGRVDRLRRGALLRERRALPGRASARRPPCPATTTCTSRSATPGQRIGRVGVPNPEGNFTMKNLSDILYDLSLVDFEQLFRPVTLEGVEPGGEAVEMVLERR